MTVKYLVESVRAPGKLCFWGAMQMLMRYHRHRFGLSTFTEFDDIVQSRAVPKTMLNASDIRGLVEKHGLSWGYMPGNKRVLEQVLSLGGPLIYICYLTPAGSVFQHSVLITGIEDGAVEPNILFNDPGDGGKKMLPFSRFFLGYPPYMKSKSGDKTLIIWGGNRRPQHLPSRS